MDQSDLGAGSENEQRVTTTLDRRTFLKVAGGAIGAAALSQVAPFLEGRALARSTGPVLYSLQNIGSRPPFVLTTGSGQKVGLAYRAAWGQTQRTEQRFDWSFIDAALGEAEANGVPFALSITAGINTLPWVYDAGVQRFEFQAEDRSLVMPVPWDGVYLRLWTNFMGAVGARYGTRVSRIGFTGINSTTQEVLLPADPGALANWEDAGYSNHQIEHAFDEFGSAIVAAFPSSVPVAGMHGNNFLPSLPRNPDVTQGLIDFGVAHWPNFVLQYNGAVGLSPLLWSGVSTYQTNFPGRTLGLQAGAPLGATLMPRLLAQAESLGAAWLELYPTSLAFI